MGISANVLASANSQLPSWSVTSVPEASATRSLRFLTYSTTHGFSVLFGSWSQPGASWLSLQSELERRRPSSSRQCGPWVRVQ